MEPSDDVGHVFFEGDAIFNLPPTHPPSEDQPSDRQATEILHPPTPSSRRSRLSVDGFEPAPNFSISNEQEFFRQ